MTKIYLAVRVYATFHLLYELWIFLFHRKMYGLWDMLYRRARIMYIWIRRWRKNLRAARLEREKRQDMRKERKKKEMPERIPASDCDVMGKTKTVYIENPQKTRTEPVKSEPLPESDFIGEEDEISPDDVEYNPDAVPDADDAELQELMEPPLSEPDPDFSRSMTYEDIQNMADVLSGKESDESKRVRAAETIHDIQDTDFFEFLRREAVNREKVEALMREYFDENGEPRKKTVEGTNDVAGFDWSLYV